MYKKSFLKWPGGKSKLLPVIMPELAGHNRLIEPFCGSAVVSLNFDGPTLTSDANSHLINCLLQAGLAVDRFIMWCESLFSRGNNAEQYYRIRSLFNNDPLPERFLYLNKHCFNGLIRYNKNGGFNAPFGAHKHPSVPVEEIHAFAEHFSTGGMELACLDFQEAMKTAVAGDVIYCDPPYVPASITASFTGYTSGAFGELAQRLLAKNAVQCQQRGVKVVISNSDNAFTRELYGDADRLVELNVQRSISCDGATRGTARELLAIYESKG